MIEYLNCLIYLFTKSLQVISLCIELEAMSIRIPHMPPPIPRRSHFLSPSLNDLPPPPNPESPKENGSSFFGPPVDEPFEGGDCCWVPFDPG